MEWRRYCVETTGDIGAAPCVIEAPSPGVAVEYYLAIHGLLVYHEITCQTTNDPADETRPEVLAVMPEAEKMAAHLDEFHFILHLSGQLPGRIERSGEMVNKIVVGETSSSPIVIQLIKLCGCLCLDIREHWWLDENSFKPSRHGINLGVTGGQAEEVLLAALSLLDQGATGAEEIGQELEWALLDT